jgi:spore coat polysaccharide biosynthesis protein SpsF
MKKETVSNIVAIIQARIGSTRLPGKVLLKLGERTVLEQVIERVAAAGKVNRVIVATTDQPADLEIVKLCEKKGIGVFVGAENDVLDRFYQAAKLYQADHIVRITADCPLIDPAVINEVIEEHLNSKADYTANTIKETYPDGEDVEVFTFDVLKRVWQEARLASEREHVTPYIRKHGELFKLISVEYPEDHSAKRWTLDNLEDYKFIKLVYDKLYKRQSLFGMSDVFNLLKDIDEMDAINQHLTRNSGYQKSLQEDVALDQRKG